jgi:hypothetical protein
MGVVRTIKSEDGKPYVSLEDLIGEIESVKKSNINEEETYDDRPNFIDIVLKTLHQMESEYYDKYLFRKKDKE